MESRRILILVVSVVLGVLAALSAFSYLRGTQDRANKDARLVQVYVVKKDIPKGLPGQKARDEKYIVADKINSKFRPSTAVIDLTSITDKVALTPLSPNQVVVDGMFVSSRVAQVTNKERIEPGKVAIAISVDGVRGVGNSLVPGDRVNIMSFAKIDITKLPKPAAGVPVAEGEADHGLTLLYQNVEILAINGNFAPQPGETQTAVAPGAGTILIAVPQEAAERIVLASQSSTGIYMALVPPNNPAISVPPVAIQNLFGVPCVSLGGDNQPGTADDVPKGCIPLEPNAPVTTTTTLAPAAP